MSNMNGRRRKRARKFLIERDGNVCKKCRVSGKKKKLVIDHIDNNNSNNNYDNMQLLCYACSTLIKTSQYRCNCCKSNLRTKSHVKKWKNDWRVKN